MRSVACPGSMVSLPLLGHNENRSCVLTWRIQVKPEEMKNLVAILDGNGAGPAVDKAFGDGLHVGGERFVAFNIADRHVYGRKVRRPLVQCFLYPFHSEARIRR